MCQSRSEASSAVRHISASHEAEASESGADSDINIADRVVVGGAIKFNEKGPNVDLRSAAVLNLKAKPTVVLPAENASAKQVFPIPGWDKRV